MPAIDEAREKVKHLEAVVADWERCTEQRRKALAEARVELEAREAEQAKSYGERMAERHIDWNTKWNDPCLFFKNLDSDSVGQVMSPKYGKDTLRWTRSFVASYIDAARRDAFGTVLAMVESARTRASATIDGQPRTDLIDRLALERAIKELK